MTLIFILIFSPLHDKERYQSETIVMESVEFQNIEDYDRNRLDEKLEEIRFRDNHRNILLQPKKISKALIKSAKILSKTTLDLGHDTYDKFIELELVKKFNRLRGNEKYVVEFERDYILQVDELEHLHKKFKLQRQNKIKNSIKSIENLRIVNKKAQKFDIVQKLKKDQEEHDRKLQVEDFIRRKEDAAKRLASHKEKLRKLKRLEEEKRERKRLKDSEKHWKERQKDYSNAYQQLQKDAAVFEKETRVYTQSKEKIQPVNLSVADNDPTHVSFFDQYQHSSTTYHGPKSAADFSTSLSSSIDKCLNDLSSRLLQSTISNEIVESHTILVENNDEVKSRQLTHRPTIFTEWVDKELDVSNTDPQVNLFTSTDQKDIQQELSRYEVYELQQKKAQTEQKYKAIVYRKKQIEEEISVNNSILSRLHIEASQVDSEINLFQYTLRKPIQRNPTPKERDQLHFLKNKQTKIRNEIKVMKEKTLANLQQTYKSNEEILSKCASKMVFYQNESKKREKELNELSDDLAGVPMVVGRNIGKVIDPFVARPVETTNVLVQTSKLEIIRSQVHKVLDEHTRRVDKTNAEGWKLRLEKEFQTGEFERLRSQLTHIANRIAKGEDDEKRNALNRAIERFWRYNNSGNKSLLRSVNTNNQVSLSSTSDEDGDCILSDYVKQTRLDMQKGTQRITLLSTELLAARESTSKTWDSGIIFGMTDASDHESNTKGSNIRGTYSLPGSGTCVQKRIKKNLAKGNGTKFVQRYHRISFIAMVEKEIASYRAEHKKKLIEDSLETDQGDSRYQRMIHSKDNYLKRKQAIHADDIAKAKDLVGSKITVLDNPFQGNFFVHSCNVEWVDNETIPKILHNLQECNSSWEITDNSENNLYKLLSVDLAENRYFVYRSQNKDQIIAIDDGSVSSLSTNFSYVYDENGKKHISIPIQGFERAKSKATINENDQEFFSSMYEKERLEVRESQDMFYDFDVTKSVHNICLRHGFQKNRIQLHRSEETDDQLSDDITFRLEDEKRRAAFYDILDKMSRYSCFKMRISELKHKRTLLLADKASALNELSHYRNYVHDSEKELNHLLADLQDANDRISEAAVTKATYKKAMDELAFAEERASLASQKTEGLEQIAEDTKLYLLSLGEEIESLKEELDCEIPLKPKLDEKVFLVRTYATESHVDLLKSDEDVRCVLFQRRGQIVPTRFGPKKVLHYREHDETLCLSFPFGTHELGMYAKMYIPIHESLSIEEKQRNIELKNMSLEEDDSKIIYKHFERQRHKEMMLMFREEREMREYIINTSITVEEKLIQKKYWQLALKKANKEIQKPEKQKELNKRIESALTEYENKLKGDGEGKESTASFHNDSNITRAMSKFFGRIRIKKDVGKTYLRELARKDTFEVNQALQEERSKKVTLPKIIDLFTNEAIEQLLKELCSEVLENDAKKKLAAEKESNIVFPKDPFLSFEVYSALKDLWIDKKRKLREQLGEWSVRDGHNYLAEFMESGGGGKDMEELEREIERKKKEKIERERIKALCEEMAAEDTLCRTFYHEEFREMIHERQRMMVEEHRMKILLEEEEAERRLRESKYNVLQSSSTSRQSENLIRRSALKQGAIERVKIQKEIKQMEEEDKLSRRAQALYRKVEQLRMLNAEMDVVFDSFDHKLPYPSNSDSNCLTDKERDNIKWRKKMDEAIAIQKCKELEYMEKDGNARLCENELWKVEARIKDLLSHIQSLNEKESKAKLDAKNALHRAIIYHAASGGASKWKERCEEDVDKKLLLFETAKSKEKWSDTSVFTKFNQRWKTKQLQKKLHDTYFAKLVDSIICKAQLESCKNRVLYLDQRISENQEESRKKAERQKLLWCEYRREEHLRMYRSCLGKKFFTKSRKKALSCAFKGWKYYVGWHQGQKQAFYLRFATIKQGMDIKHVHANTQQSLFWKKENIQANTTQKPLVESTFLHKHKARQIRCVQCNIVYTENLNHKYACCFHPGTYGQHNGDDAMEKCWSCCGNMEPNSRGCRACHHVPPSTGHAPYRKQYEMHLLNDCATLHKLNDEISKSILKTKESQGKLYYVLCYLSHP